MARVLPLSPLLACAVFAAVWLCVALLAEEVGFFCSAPVASTAIIVKLEIKTNFFMTYPPFVLSTGRRAAGA